MEQEPGAYTVQGVGANAVTTGKCAGCLGDVTSEDAFVIRYSLDGTPGGIFHRTCDPMRMDPVNWYSL